MKRALGRPKDRTYLNLVSYEAVFGEGIRSGARGSGRDDALTHCYDYIILRVCGISARNPALADTVPEKSRRGCAWTSALAGALSCPRTSHPMKNTCKDSARVILSSAPSSAVHRHRVCEQRGVQRTSWTLPQQRGFGSTGPKNRGIL